MQTYTRITSSVYLYAEIYQTLKIQKVVNRPRRQSPALNYRYGTPVPVFLSCDHSDQPTDKSRMVPTEYCFYCGWFLFYNRHDVFLTNNSVTVTETANLPCHTRGDTVISRKKEYWGGGLWA